MVSSRSFRWSASLWGRISSSQVLSPGWNRLSICSFNATCASTNRDARPYSEVSAVSIQSRLTAVWKSSFKLTCVVSVTAPMMSEFRQALPSSVLSG